MKWIYLPTLFALAFFYTKTSFTDILPKKVKVALPKLRKPASIEENKKSAIENFTPGEFYKNLNSNGVSQFYSVLSFKGIIVGDAQVDNFGFIIGDNKKSHYTLIDFSEVSQGQLYLDVISHLVSAKSLDKSISWMEYFEAYKRGLNREAQLNSFYVIQGNENAILNAENLLKLNISNEIEFSKLKKGYQKLSSNKQASVETALKKLFPQIQYFDMRESNLTAGSIQVLARLRPIDKVQWLMIKEKKESDHDKIFGHDDVFTLKSYHELLKKNIYDGHLDMSLMTISIESKPFTIKFAEQYSTKLNFKEIPEEDLKDIIMDQAYAIGAIHSRSLGENLEKYIRAWAKIPSTIVDEKAVELKHRLKDQE